MKLFLAMVATVLFTAAGAVGQQYPAQQDQYPQTQQQYPQTQQPYPQQQQYPQTQSTQTSTYPQSGPQQQTVHVENNTLPPGTQLSVRSDEQITATSDNVGQTYAGEIANNVVDQNGRLIIPYGSPARLTIADMSTGTMGVGNNQVALALQSVRINGIDYMVQSNTQTASGDRGIGANKRTAEMTGGGAVLGTVIGAIAGGAKGAVLGAVVGGAAGGAAQVLTRGKEVSVPAETVLTFKLDQPVQLNATQNSYPNNSTNPYPPQR